MLALPITAFIIALLCTWYLGAEDQRLRMVRSAYYKTLSDDCVIPRMPTTNWWEKLIAIRIGTAITVIFGLCLTILSFINAVFLWFYHTKILITGTG